MKRLGLVLDQVIFSSQGRYSTDEAFIQFMEEFARVSFDKVEFCSRVAPAQEHAPYPLDPAFFEILPVPWYPSVSALCARGPVLLPRIARILGAAMANWDMVIATGVHPLTPIALRLAAQRRLPAQLWLRSDMVADLKFRLVGLRRIAGLAVARLTAAAIPDRTPVVSIGRDDYPLLARMGRVCVAYDSKFGAEDLVSSPSARHPGGREPRLLYVGRIAPEKGLEVLLEALRLLREERHGAPPSLTLVGSDLQGSHYGDDFRRHLEASDLAGAVTMVGHVPYGSRLFAYYDSHDLLVLPSMTEGFPQVLLEAMARGLPVVATRVGGVPSVVQDRRNGLLVAPGDRTALASACARILGNPELSAGLAREGLRSAREYTREVQVAAIGRFTHECFPEAGIGVSVPVRP